MWYILITLLPVVTAEPTLYMFPTNPILHPNGMYPNPQLFRGKVRDLPDSGLIYLNRIKPIGQEIQTPIKTTKLNVDKNTEPKLTMIEKFDKALSSFEKYSSEENKMDENIKPLNNEIKFTSLTKPTKIDEPKKSIVKTKQGADLSIPEEIELERILNEIMIGNSQSSASLPKIGRSSAVTNMEPKKFVPRVIAFDGTARVSKPERSRPVTVRLMPRKLYSRPTRTGADFDPWERLGQ